MKVENDYLMLQFYLSDMCCLHLLKVVVSLEVQTVYLSSCFGAVKAFNREGVGNYISSIDEMNGRSMLIQSIQVQTFHPSFTGHHCGLLVIFDSVS